MAALKTKITKKTSAKGKGKKPARKKPADGKYVDRTDDEPSTDESMDGHIDSHELDTASNARSNGVDLLKKATEKTILKVKQRDPEKDKTTSFTAKDFQQAFVSTQCSICGAVGYHHWLSLVGRFTVLARILLTIHTAPEETSSLGTNNTPVGSPLGRTSLPWVLG